MKNLKKLSRTELKSISGGGLPEGGGFGCSAVICSWNDRISKGAKCGTVPIVCC